MLEKTFQPDGIESRLLDKWEDEGVFACDPGSSAAPFTIMMPPPNVTGNLHVGHALTYTLQDILTRYKRMKGFDALWQPGTDHASIAVHMVLENQMAQEGTDRQTLGREAFMKRAWEWKDFSHGKITGQLRRLGVGPDWSRERFTMDEGLSAAVTKIFIDLYNDKLIYRAERLVNWDPERQSVISDIEVEMKEVKGHLWHIQYPIEGDEARTITVATTRPETMLGDTAIAVHPDDERYKDLVGKFAVLPLVGRLLPIVADEYADPEQGSGAVKITPAHDFNDFEVGRRHNLEVINIFDERAHINENAPDEYQGLERFEARKRILAELEAQDLLVKVDDIKHAVPLGQRSGVLIEPYLTLQWFCDSPTLAKEAAKAVRDGRTSFYPRQYENMYFDWVDNQLPWCISRQLWWGHQIPAWYDQDGNVYVAESEEQALQDAREVHGDNVRLTRDSDVLDTWFSSALWPFSTLGWPERTPELARYYPTDVLITGFDIITFWVSRMMMFSLYAMKEVPFRDVYIHALVRDEKGQKMSKSRGNVIDPLEMIDRYGADALRFTLCAMAAQGRDIRLSEERIEGYRNFATKLWNAARYCQMNGCTPDPDFDPAAAQYTPNSWIIGEVARTVQKIDAAMDAYRFNEAAGQIYHFTWGTFCDWYLEFTKPVLSDAQNAYADETRKTTGWVLDQILALLSPFMPFITEELYNNIAARPPGADILMVRPLPDAAAIPQVPDSGKAMDWLIRTISEIRSVRSDMNVPAGAKIDLLVKGASCATKENFGRFEEIMCRMARLETIRVLEDTDDLPKGAVRTVVDEATLALPIADIIDLDKERARLRKEIDKLTNQINSIDQKLENKKFIENAPDEVIGEQKRRREDAESTREKLTQALGQLDAA